MQKKSERILEQFFIFELWNMASVVDGNKKISFFFSSVSFEMVYEIFFRRRNANTFEIGKKEREGEIGT